ncbi:pentatricopeptide repeat-containing protein At5g08305-like [Primulina tabacum]|uniref:pentatricopeptide repeat-containing protein At5g08305-like n=1 Tax=Primulina tabacum TaxID=48773 RepID=UPI003F59C816
MVDVSSSVFLNLLDKCSSSSQLKQIQALLTSSGLSNIHPFTGKILSLAAISLDIDYAHRYFLQLSNPMIFHYNALIRAFSNSKTPHRSILTFVQLLLHGVAANHLTYPFLVKASARLSNPVLGGCIHAHASRNGFASDLFVSNSLIHMYGTCGEIENAQKVFGEMLATNLVSWNTILDAFAKCGDVVSMREVFDTMPERNVVSWSSLIDGYVKDGNHREALSVFETMRANGKPKANEVTMVSVLCACSHLGALQQGRSMHRYIVENKLPITLVLRTSLVDMYAKCGAIEEALVVFREVSARYTDVLLWNAMIGGLATHGCAVEALDLYKEMRELGIKSDEITYLCLLNACAHGGLVKEAREYLDIIAKNGMAPKAEHYACVVDVLARAGHVDEAYSLVSQMPIEPTASMLGALFNGCINYRKFEVAEAVGRKLIELEGDHDGRYIGLSNAYAVIKWWDEARRTREEMESRGVKKFAGCSFVEVLGKLHRFIAHDLAHSKFQEIYFMLGVLVEHMKLNEHPARLEIHFY